MSDGVMADDGGGEFIAGTVETYRLCLQLMPLLEAFSRDRGLSPSKLADVLAMASGLMAGLSPEPIPGQFSTAVRRAIKLQERAVLVGVMYQRQGDAMFEGWGPNDGQGE